MAASPAGETSTFTDSGAAAESGMRSALATFAWPIGTVATWLGASGFQPASTRFFVSLPSRKLVGIAIPRIFPQHPRKPIIPKAPLQPRHGMKGGLGNKVPRQPGGAVDVRRVVVVEEIKSNT